MNEFERLSAWLEGDGPHRRYLHYCSRTPRGVHVVLSYLTEGGAGSKKVSATAPTLSEAIDKALDAAKESGL